MTCGFQHLRVQESHDFSPLKSVPDVHEMGIEKPVGSVPRRVSKSSGRGADSGGGGRAFGVRPPSGSAAAWHGTSGPLTPSIPPQQYWAQNA